MDANSIAQTLASIPALKQVSHEKAFWLDTVEETLPIIVDDIVDAHDWDFACGVYSSLVTVKSQAEYTVEGTDNDCRDIINIRYGDDETVLPRFLPQDMDEIISNDQEPTGVFGWYQYKRDDNGFPVAKLFNAPATAGETLAIRYRKRGVNISRFPDSFGKLVVTGILALIGVRSEVDYKNALRKAIRRYSVGGKDVQIGSINPQSVKTNNNIAAIYGTG